MKDKNSLIGKKGWPSLKQKKAGGGAGGAGAMYVSPYSKNPNPK
jgi:hypothetical protein